MGDLGHFPGALGGCPSPSRSPYLCQRLDRAASKGNDDFCRHLFSGLLQVGGVPT